MFDKYSTIGFKLKDENDFKTLQLINGERTQYYGKNIFGVFVILLTFIVNAFKIF